MSKPNVIIIQCEDLGYGDLGCYGSKVHDTPALDQLAADGVRFTDYSSTAAVCTPARAALLTGCFAQRIGMTKFRGTSVCFPGEPTGLNPDETTIASMLKANGYATYMVGKWHCGDQPEFLPTSYGFDHYFGVPFSNDMGRQVTREDRPPLPLLRDKRVVEQQPDQAALTERYTADAVEFLRAHQDEPFFLYFAHMHMHLPHYAPKRFLEQSRNGQYGASLGAIDWSVSVLLRALDDLGLAENTLVIFTADHGSRAKEGGPDSNKPLRGCKAQHYEGGSRVACIMRWTGTIPAGQTCDHLATGVDLLPTIGELTGATIPTDKKIDGSDIRPLIFGEPEAGPSRDTLPYYLKDDLRAVREGDWKLHLADDELYNLADDIGETTNVFDQHPDIVERLRKVADEYRADLGDTLTDTVGKGRREPGVVQNATPLTQYDKTFPYAEPIYTNPQAG